ncbi:flagellar export protein FliJ [Caldanaerobius polysaccharolyticus]|uniref:flagellar export protein FliJ n=1 Tax=Caldanaerobius polysaccharolyticus TaxID=44256 RepID=UPI00047B4A17|nr:flagellar export protein FliJ [Caldanaerobius polysaccharolyticus]
MGYVFRLKRIADLSLQRQKKLKSEFSLKMSHLRSAKKVLDRFIDKEKEILNHLESASTKPLSALEYQYSYRSLWGVRQDLSNQLEVIEKIQKELDSIRQELVKTSQDIKMLDKLDEKCYKEYIKKLDKLEQNNIDQFVSNRYITKVI